MIEDKDSIPEEVEIYSLTPEELEELSQLMKTDLTQTIYPETDFTIKGSTLISIFRKMSELNSKVKEYEGVSK